MMAWALYLEWITHLIVYLDDFLFLIPLISIGCVCQVRYFIRRKAPLFLGRCIGSGNVRTYSVIRKWFDP